MTTAIHSTVQTFTARQRPISLLLIALLSLVMSGCKPVENVKAFFFGNTNNQSENSHLQGGTNSGKLVFQPRTFAEIKAASVLRVLQPKWENNQYLPRQGMPADEYKRLILDFAQAHQLDIQWVPVDSFSHLIPRLMEGAGDVIVTNLTQTKAREQVINFTRPLTQVRELLVVNKRHEDITSPETLAESAVSIRVPAQSSFEESALKLKKEFPQISVSRLSGADQPDEIIDLIEATDNTVSIMDSNTVEVAKTYRDNFRVAFPVSKLRNIAWGVRKNNPELLSHINQFITINAFTASRSNQIKGDWPEIKKRRTLRVLTKNHPASYFIWRGELMGFDFDLVKRFAKQQNLHLEIIVPPNDEDILDHLLQGTGDLVAATLTKTEEREARGISFTRPIINVSETLVTATENPKIIESLADLRQEKIIVNRFSSFWTTLAKEKNFNPPKQSDSYYLEASPDALSTMDLIELVADGEILYTVADSHLLDIELTYRDNIRPALVLGDPVPIAWATRKENQELLSQLNNYLKKENRSLFFNVTYDKYFKNKRNILNNKEGRVTKGSQLSPWDHITKKHAKEYEFDWRLITAQMYQESQFNPKAKSHAGAVGLMQVLPKTAKQLGFTELFEPEVSIEAGIAYLDWTRDRFPETLPIEERVRFSLAAYNAGFGHVYDARRLARQLGLDPNRWFNNVEKAIKLLSKPQYYQKARFGYCRGSEPAAYVRQIENRYHAYLAAH